jgi:hypothetical protein
VSAVSERAAPLSRLLLLTLLAAAACSPEAGAQAASMASCRGPRVAPPAIDSVQLLRDLSALAADSMEGRAMGTAGAARARAYLVARMQAMGLEPVGEGLQHPFGRDGGVNLMGLVPGTTPGPFILVTAHYDHLGVRGGQVYNGADDNASGTAAALAIAGGLLRNRPRHPVLIVLFDGEESGLEGARAFTKAPPFPLDSILIDINLDMVSRNASGELFAVGPRYRPGLVPLVEGAACASDVKLMFGHDKGEPDDWMPQSDQQPFHRAGVPFIYLGVEDHEDYHQPTDDVSAIDPAFYVGATRAIAALVHQADAHPAAARR